MKQCKRCVKCLMDDTAEEIKFYDDGCSFCRQAKQAIKEMERDKHSLSTIINKIKKDGKKNKYDCLLGLSGGVDSSTVLHHAINLGLKPLCFSLDNTWNTPRADRNIQRMVKKLGVDYEVIKIDMSKYGELQDAFFKGGVKNIEAITDHILFAITYEMAVKNGIKWILSGGNTNTESIMPASWGEDQRDLRWIKSVYKSYTGKKLTGLPVIPLWKEQYYRLIKRVKFCRLLDYLDYNRDESIKILNRKYGYKPYGEKHCENKFTMWFQNYWLPTHYGIDKRKAHLSSLIVSGQITRDEALKILESKPEYPVLGIEYEDLKVISKKSYNDYPNSEFIRKIVVLLYKLLKFKWIRKK